MISREEALHILGLDAEPTPERQLVQRAFERLSRRYPPSQFPDRFAQIQAARDRLLDEQAYWRQCFDSSALDLSWLQAYLPKDPLQMLTVMDDRDWLQMLLRNSFMDVPLRRHQNDDE